MSRRSPARFGNTAQRGICDPLWGWKSAVLEGERIIIESQRRRCSCRCQNVEIKKSKLYVAPLVRNFESHTGATRHRLSSPIPRYCHRFSSRHRLPTVSLPSMPMVHSLKCITLARRRYSTLAVSSRTSRCIATPRESCRASSANTT